MRNPFQPIGDKSRRAILVDLVADIPEDTILSYADIASALDVDEDNRELCQGVVNAAKRGIEATHSKALVAVPNVGYRVVKASEHLGLAQHHQKRGRRQLVRAKSKVAHVDMSKLTKGERAAVGLAVTSLGLQMDYMRRNDLRASRLEDAVAVVAQTTERSEQEIAELRERLSRLEQIGGDAA